MPPSPSNRTSPTGTKARYLMIGGFLGAGKTTAIGKLAHYLSQQGKKVGLITNDQGRNLVDTAMLRSQGFATEEIPGGCFCCRFNSLMEASQRLTEATRPDVFIAEPVGSCTDLVATVTYPLRRMYGEDFTVGPISVLVDPFRAARVFGLEPGGSFSSKVLYIYRKQIEEADLVLLSKSDLLNAPRLNDLQTAFAREYRGKEVMAVSARTGANLETWFSRIIDGQQVSREAMEIDYATYADGEALLGWLNCTAQISSNIESDANRLLMDLAAILQEKLSAKGVEIAHLKMTFSPEASLSGGIAAVSLVRNDFVPELSVHLEEPLHSGELILNLRAEAPPNILGETVAEGLASIGGRFPGLKATLDHLEHFRPGKPVPTHRISVLVD